MKFLKLFPLLILTLFLTNCAYAQQTIKDLTVNDFKVENVKQGSKPCPLMTETQRNAIATPQNGRCIYNTTAGKLNIYNSTAGIWKAAGGGVDSWVTAFSYSVDDLVIQSNKIYQCLTAHTSGTFATDLANGEWVELSAQQDLTGEVTTIGSSATVTNDAVIAKTLTGFASAAGTISSTDSILQALQKADGNTALKLGNTKSDVDGSSVVTTELQTPNDQLTTTDTNKRRIETGNGNLLSNPSFEAGTYNSGWTCSLGSTTLETTAKTDGNQANAINSIGAGVRCYQTSTTNAANLKGLLGSAILKVKTTDSIYKVCGLVDGNAAANERNCITVKPTSTDLPFYPARTDFYMGGTSNGIVVYTTTTTSQPTVIDDAFVGVFNGGLSQFSNDTAPRSATYTLTNFGNATVTGTVSREGVYANFKGRITIGSTLPSGTFTLNLPSGYSMTGSNDFKHGAATVYKSTAVAAFYTGQPYSQSATTIGFAGGSSAGVWTGNTVPAALIAGDFIEFDFRAQIAGWEANTNAAIAGCVSAAGCTDTFSAKVSSAGVVSDENVDFINGNCVMSGTNSAIGTCSFPVGVFTQPPTCTVSAVTGAAITANIHTQATVSSFSYYGYNTSTGTNSAIPVNINCQRAAADFKPKTVVVSPLQGYVKVPGAENLNVEMFKLTYGATSSTSCTAANTLCAYNNNIAGSGITVSKRATAGLYTVNMPRQYTNFKCTGNVVAPGVSLALINSVTPECTNCSSVNFETASLSNTNVDTKGTLDCTGVF